MKRILWLLLVVADYTYGQSEFKTYSNGLIYDEHTMHRLGIIVDSLNVRFRSCDLSHPYFSKMQGMGVFVELPSKKAREQVRKGITLDEFSKLFPDNVKKRIWVVKSRYENYEGKRIIEYASLPGNGERHEIEVNDNASHDKAKGWIISPDGEEAVWLDGLTSIELPMNYARLVQYVDCMVDTTTEIFFPQAKGRVLQEVSNNSKAADFLQWVESLPGKAKPDYPDYEKTDKADIDSLITSYYKRQNEWDSLRITNLDKVMARSAYRLSVLMEATDEGIEKGNSDPRLEFYVERYVSKEKALQLKRGRRVVGFCSMDQSPRYHAMSICKLSAETAQWDIFLRSHLDVMNDRFERQSDGSYAWAGRKTYLKELEELDIHAVDLLIGTSLRVENVSENHYWGSINRVGRALSDASDKPALESRLLAMIHDDKLDIYNRLLIAYLFDHYAYNLEDEQEKEVAIKKLKSALLKAPASIQSAFEK
jgi:hypothetical protein